MSVKCKSSCTVERKCVGSDVTEFFHIISSLSALPHAQYLLFVSHFYYSLRFFCYSWCGSQLIASYSFDNIRNLFKCSVLFPLWIFRTHIQHGWRSFALIGAVHCTMYNTSVNGRTLVSYSVNCRKKLHFFPIAMHWSVTGIFISRCHVAIHCSL